MSACLKIKKSKEETSYMKNGSLLTEELIIFCNGKPNPIRMFSAKELRRATNDYDQGQLILYDVDYELYKGSLKGRPISVKKYRGDAIGSAIKDTVIGSQMSAHKNVLKLIGCCLETEIPTLVHEYVGHETLSKCIYGTNGMQPLPIPWKCRIRIALDIANAVAYLHNKFSRPIIHRDITSSTIILDQNYVAKLIDFSQSISIPEGQSHVEDALRGTLQFFAPEYVTKGYITQKADVFSFGPVLLELLTGQTVTDLLVHPRSENIRLGDRIKSYVEQNQIIEIVDPSISKEGIEQEQLLAFTMLALSCICEKEEDRPTMIDIAKQLRQINRSVSPPC